MKKRHFLATALALVTIFLITLFPVKALDCSDSAMTDCDGDVECMIEVEEICKSNLKETQGRAQTLASTIKYLNNQIALTEVQITRTSAEVNALEGEIANLSVRIDNLNQALDKTAQRLRQRVISSYKRNQVKSFYYLISSRLNPSNLKYMYAAESQDKNLLLDMEESRITYDEQKSLKQEKQAELESLQAKLANQKLSLAQQQSSKQTLLEQTKNDEKRFQNLLAKARAEIEAIQAVLAGKGTEVEVGKVSEGESIASIIAGPSACSTGTHLHFEVASGGSNYNPASYLSNKDVDWSLCGWFGCDSPVSFTGSWRWPIEGRPIITQVYGMTAYARSGAYGGAPHTGMDMVSSDLSVKAVKNGTLYRGSIACGGGTLRYVKLNHQDSDVDTYYLHINYIK